MSVKIETLTLQEVVKAVEAGQLRVPAFQRDFVWEPERVALFMDSIYKGYPYGALLIWRTTKKEQLKADKSVGPVSLPDPKDEFPIDYILDGQQRITSVFLTFQSLKDISESEKWKNIYFDLSVSDGSQDQQCFALSAVEVDPKVHFPLKSFFNTVEYRKQTEGYDNILKIRLDEIQERFKTASIPLQVFKPDTKGSVAIIFERINRQGVRLNTMQLLSAWTWSEDFQLKEQFENLKEEIDEFQFEAEGVEENLMLRCTSAILKADPRPEIITELSGESIRLKFDEVHNGIKGALDFVRMNLNVQKIINLPYPTIIVPLSTFFAVPKGRQVRIKDAQRTRIIRWFWRLCFSKRYSSRLLGNLQDDIGAMINLREGKDSKLGEFQTIIDPNFFLDNSFVLRNVNAKTYILMLTLRKPLSFVSGQPVDLSERLKEYNKVEFHHLMPKAFLKRQSNLKYGIDCLANMAFSAKNDNMELGGVPPSQYKAKMPSNQEMLGNILRSAYCDEALFQDDFNSFAELRSKELLNISHQLIA